MSERSIQEQREKSALRSGVWYTVSSISVKAVLVITTPIFTRLMSASDYGISATFTTWFALLSTIFSLNLWYSVGRAKIDFPGKLDEFVGSIQLLALSFTATAGAVSFLFFDKICSLFGMGKPFVVALFIYLLAYPAVQITQSKFKYQYNYKGNIAITVYTTLSTAAISFVLVLLMSDQQALGKSLGAVISAVLLAAIVWVYTLKKGFAKINTEYWKYALKISVPLIFNSVSLNILAQSDRIFITKYCGEAHTGIYSLAYSYAVLINVVLDAVNQAWLPWFHDSLNDKLTEQIRSGVKQLVIFGCWFGVVCIAVAPEAVALLGGAAYRDGIWAVPPVALGVVCIYIFQQYEHIELHLKKTWYISAGTIAAAVVNIVLNIIFIPRFGFVAAAYTTLVCYLLLMIFHHFISRFILKVHLYNDKFMYIALLATIALSVIFMALYKEHWTWRWCLIAAVSMIYLYADREYIIALVQRFIKK